MLKKMPRIFVLCLGGTFCSVMSPKGYVAKHGVIERLKMFKTFYDEEFSQKFGCQPDECITPVTPFNKRIFWKLSEAEVFLDSSNMTIKDHVYIAEEIQKVYN